MSSLEPVINSISIDVHVPVESVSHVTLHVSPSVMTSPGAGSVGVGSARTSWTAARENRAERARVEEEPNMIMYIFESCA